MHLFFVPEERPSRQSSISSSEFATDSSETLNYFDRVIVVLAGASRLVPKCAEPIRNKAFQNRVDPWRHDCEPRG